MQHFCLFPHTKTQVMSKRRYIQLSAGEQRDIVEEYAEGAAGKTMQEVADDHRVAKSTVHAVIDRARRHGNDPVTERGHKRRKLVPCQEAKLLRTIEADPMATNRDLARAVGNVIAPRTVSHYLARAEPPITSKVIQDQEPEELTNDWKTACRQWLRRVVKMRLDDRVYVDESAIHENEAPRNGRSRRGKPIFRPRSRYAKKYTLHVYARRTGVVHWELCAKNADTTEVERVANDAAAKLKTGDIVIWDRLGRSGRSKQPVAQHYSPAARGSIESAGARLEFLPPKAKYFNPLELLFNDLKSHYIRPAFARNQPRLSFQQLKRLIANYMETKAPDTLPGFFRARANGATAITNQLL
jgi:transposase